MVLAAKVRALFHRTFDSPEFLIALLIVGWRVAVVPASMLAVDWIFLSVACWAVSRRCKHEYLEGCLRITLAIALFAIYLHGQAPHTWGALAPPP